jgi:hypothetical protein
MVHHCCTCHFEYLYIYVINYVIVNLHAYAIYYVILFSI